MHFTSIKNGAIIKYMNKVTGARKFIRQPCEILLRGKGFAFISQGQLADGIISRGKIFVILP